MVSIGRDNAKEKSVSDALILRTMKVSPSFPEVILAECKMEQMEYDIGNGFKATNNEAEYEALLARLRVTTELEIRQIPREKNKQADALANLASAFDIISIRSIPLAFLPNPSIDVAKTICQAKAESIWMDGIIAYLKGRDQYSRGGENQKQGETSEYRGETKNPAILVENVAVVQQFLKLKSPTLKGGMDLVKANDWLSEMEKNFRLLRCGERQKVKIGATVVEYEASFTNLAKYVPHLVAKDVIRAQRFEDGLRHKIKRVISPLVLPTYVEVLNRAIIVEQDEIERKIYFDRGHIKKNCPNLRVGAIVLRGGNAKPVSNRPVNQGNRGGGGNE
ncbi:hypothetical protein Acr_07g0013410 [Actinidia rufa]|uniref:Reverse transcriptase n=1 Tax=Actinidia rufa TaxID=165716 RepID=A0A7J0EXH2_9ERIC|nr:hypothetical protein Acr_07g0013410 [Actinidia rufa]